MLPLRELQSRFCAALFDGHVEPMAPWIHTGHDTSSGPCTNALSAQERLGIYRNNLTEGFAKALELGFPVLQRLVGKECFGQLARAFQREYPSRCGDLNRIGADFPGFLHGRFETSEYAYLPDVAALEWACQQSLLAPEIPALEPSALRAIPADAYGELRFSLNPSCRRVRSVFPVLRIWMANQPGAATDEHIDLGAGADFLLAHRTPEGVEMTRLSAAEFELLEALEDGENLSQALDRCRALDSAFDLGRALRLLISRGALATAYLPAT
ncbi:MAG TPA: DNA-binding domain-containing protein [Steroidobacteraceae bacterium]|nr:DNA-binding domain-containing protein [Steroidobacteraceae bacterium]